MKLFFGILFLLSSIMTAAQIPDHIYKSSIHSVKLFKSDDPLAFPVIKLNSSETLQLYFDDLDASVKNYYYTYQLCNSDWSAASLKSFDYIKGFQNVRINTYRNSSIALTKYIHYQARLPENSCLPSRSGNYLLKIFLDGDTSKLVFTKRFLVVDSKVAVASQVMQPFNGAIFRTHQKLQIAFNINEQMKVHNPQDIKVVLLQNNNWTSALELSRPTIYRGNYFEYSDEFYTSFAAGKEWRWIDLRSLKLMSERMLRIEKRSIQTDVFVKTDEVRHQETYLQYRDINGMFEIENSDNINPFWQSDYGNVHFSFSPPGKNPYIGKDVYLFGELTNYAKNENAKMIFNVEKGVYENSLLLKQGFYNYSYITVSRKTNDNNFIYENVDGNYWATENSYTILVYYRSFGGRADELIGYSICNSVFK